MKGNAELKVKVVSARAESARVDGSLPHTCQLLAAAHSLCCFSPQQLSGLHCHRCLPLNGFDFGCHGDHHHEAVQMDSWAAGSAPGAAPGSPPPRHGPVAPRPGARQLHPPVWMTAVPVGREGGASLRKEDGRNSLYLNAVLQPDVWAQSGKAAFFGNVLKQRWAN